MHICVTDWLENRPTTSGKWIGDTFIGMRTWTRQILPRMTTRWVERGVTHPYLQKWERRDSFISHCFIGIRTWTGQILPRMTTRWVERVATHSYHIFSRRDVPPHSKKNMRGTWLIQISLFLVGMRARRLDRYCHIQLFGECRGVTHSYHTFLRGMWYHFFLQRDVTHLSNKKKWEGRDSFTSHLFWLECARGQDKYCHTYDCSVSGETWLIHITFFLRKGRDSYLFFFGKGRASFIWQNGEGRDSFKSHCFWLEYGRGQSKYCREWLLGEWRDTTHSYNIFFERDVTHSYAIFLERDVPHSYRKN